MNNHEYKCNKTAMLIMADIKTNIYYKSNNLKLKLRILLLFLGVGMWDRRRLAGISCCVELPNRNIQLL